MPTIKDVIVRKPSEQEKQECLQWPTWSSGVSKFDWEYTQRETCLVMEGRVTVYSPDQRESVSFGAGDMVIFPNDLACIWDVKEPVLKHYNFS
ncbi:hypothetical protein SMSP2_01563 [Limihaloglobus sulfuriphilus]|uniref:(S)-ureidoglycine aminohydrolase cupin domain-containing protein n=1 Tax=Limihaloglobus sulfuriphilus TaxID=1851148 RepID=A0A1Q2MFW5_9BACT|nr:cupin domain-containing protein [Limihaloglobus sulfuriphilus]AQQ71197.1 hypothetical protein SMSP2_01563 [Limihaloglobus sulfuriphilus]